MSNNEIGRVTRLACVINQKIQTLPLPKILSRQSTAVQSVILPG
jgi:hypothetical protein